MSPRDSEEDRSVTDITWLYQITPGIIPVVPAAELSPPLTDSSEPDEQAINDIPQIEHQAVVAIKPQPKYIPLLPKPRLPEPPKQPRNVFSRPRTIWKPLPRPCRVKMCPYKSCNLRSHREYVPNRLSLRTTAHEQQYTNTIATNLQKGDGQVQQQQGLPQLSILQGGVDGLPSLPLDGLEEPIFRELFHRFFDFQYDRIHRILRPPPLTSAEKHEAEDAKRSHLGLALSAPVFCLHFIASAHQQIGFWRGRQFQDQNTTVLYGRIMKLLRGKLSHFDPAEVSELVLVVLTLVMFEVTTGRIMNLHLHRNAVHHLIKSHGGVHNMKRSIPLILTLDRIISIYTCLPPLYASPSNQFIRRPMPVASLYGRYLDDPSSLDVIDPEVHRYCVDACRAIEILEDEGWTFDPHDPPLNDSHNLHYFFFLRDCLVNDFVRLNVSMAGDRTISRCALLAAKIVDYTALMDNYMVTLPLELADKVRRVFIDPINDFDCEKHSAILLWLLFVLASIAEPWEHHAWTLRYLKQQLDRKYAGEDWPNDWQRRELDNVRQFVWSDTKFSDRFTQACTDLQHMTYGPRTKLSIEMLAGGALDPDA